MTIIINVIKIVFLLGFLIVIHESGHFCVAKMCKIKVTEFSIGFGNKIFSKRKGETTYSLRAIPLGGYVNMPGEYEQVDDESAFCNASIWKRFLIALAGSVLNIIFGTILFFIIILTISSFKTAFKETGIMLIETFKGLIRVITGNISINQMSGPVGISQMVVETNGLIEFFYLLSQISISLGITNLLPIPALDGGRLFLIILEFIRGKKISQEVEAKIQGIGIILLLTIAIIISINDVKNII